nr:uncharacterized protein LOC117687697 isoform X2 [Crassostrea gigas]
MNEYRIFLTGDEASTWRRLVGRYYWLPDSQIISHLVQVHGLSCKDYCSLDRKLETEEKNIEQAADPLVSEAVGQYRNGGSPSNGTADSERTLEGSTAIQTPKVMEVIESCSPRFSQSDPTTASVSDQQTHTPTVEDMSTVSKEDHQSTPTTRPFSPVIISVESLANASNEDSSPFHQSAANASYENYSSLLCQSAANAINEDNSLLCQSVALPASSMEVLANSKPIMFLVKNRHNCSQMGTQSAGIKDKEPENSEPGTQESEQRPNTKFSSTINNIQGSEEVPCPPPMVDQSDSSESDPGYKSAEAPHQHSSPVNKPLRCKTTVRLEYGTKNPSKCTVTKSKEIKENESEGTFGKKRDSRKRPDRFCVYCQKIVKCGKLSRHISLSHKLEPEVQAILKKPLNTRIKFFIAKRREGIYQYNLLSINGNKKKPLMRERNTLRRDNPIKVCTDCKGFFSKSCFFRHKCVGDDISPESRRLMEIFTENLEEDSDFQDILSVFVEGEIDEFCRSNNLMKTIAYQYYNTHHRKRGKEEEVRRTTIRDVRELSRLFFQFRVMCATGKAVEDMFDTDNMKDLMEAMKLLEALNGSSQALEAESSLHYVVLRCVKSLEDFYTHTMQFKMKKELRKFKLAYTKINRKAITKKCNRRKELSVCSETTVETEVGEGNSSPDLVTKETRTEQGSCSDISMKKSGNEEEAINEGESINTSRRRSANVQDTEEASSGCPSDETSRRKSGRKPVSKTFPDEVNGSAKKIRLDNVNSEAKALTMKTRGCSVKWSREETHLLRRHFHSYIYTQNDKDDNTGNLPGKKEVLAFLKAHTIGCIKELNEKTQVQKIRTKIFNERKTSRERGRKKLSEMEALKLSVT